jgi:outer membrane protein assembly factor BamB
MNSHHDGRLSSLIVSGDAIVHNGSVLDIATGQYRVGAGNNWAGQNNDALLGDTIFNTNSGVGGAVNLPRLYAKDLATGRVIWSRAIAAPAQSVGERKVVLCSPAAWEGKVYIGFDGGILLALDAANGEELWTFEAGGPIRSSPSISANDGIIYFGCNDGFLYALDANTGAEKWKFRTGGSVLSSPCVADGVVYVGSDDGNVYAIH